MRRLLCVAMLIALVPSAGMVRSADDKEPVTGRADRRLAPFDELMTSFIREHNVPGAALAVAYHGRLVYARGFGYADRTRKVPVQPDSLFRIASVSKCLTAVAVLQLVEKKKLRLDDRVVDVLHLRPFLEPGSKPDPRWKQITILNLLQHTAGFDRDASFDPMFRSGMIARTLGLSAAPGPRDIVRYMLGRPLDFAPGERYVYSNFGYCLLGRVIEAVSGESYEKYVRDHVLRPVGAYGIALGHSLLSGRLRGEVMYYDQKGRTTEAAVGPRGRVPWPYGGWNLEAMDSHGGWVASAPDLLRFATAFDDPSRCPILSAKSIETMFARPEGAPGFDRRGKPAATYYACGWQVRPVGRQGELNTWHTGSLDGTESLLVRRADGLDWAVLFNTREDPSGKTLASAIDSQLHQAADAVRAWPDFNLFSEYSSGKR